MGAEAELRLNILEINSCFIQECKSSPSNPALDELRDVMIYLGLIMCLLFSHVSHCYSQIDPILGVGQQV
jgi:hypothetical protein